MATHRPKDSRSPRQSDLGLSSATRATFSTPGDCGEQIRSGDAAKPIMLIWIANGAHGTVRVGIKFDRMKKRAKLALMQVQAKRRSFADKCSFAAIWICATAPV